LQQRKQRQNKMKLAELTTTELESKGPLTFLAASAAGIGQVMLEGLSGAIKDINPWKKVASPVMQPAFAIVPVNNSDPTQ
jgi:hypothetical protein